MSDIVEMLVDAAGGNEAHVCAIAAAEIKRNLSQIEQLDARCGRLRDTCSTWERASNNYAEAVEIKDAEIERLRGLLREALLGPSQFPDWFISRVREALGAHFGSPVRLSVEVGPVAGTTAAQVAETQRGQRLDEAREALEADPFVRDLLDEFDGRIVPDSIRPADA